MDRRGFLGGLIKAAVAIPLAPFFLEHPVASATEYNVPSFVQLGYRPFGVFEKFFHDWSEQIVLSGPACAGKTWAALGKIDMLADKFPGSRFLIAADTFNSATIVGREVFDQPAFDLMRERRFIHGSRAWVYPNGSRVELAHLYNEDELPVWRKWMMSYYDVIYVPNVTNIPEYEWDALRSRLRPGRIRMPNGRVVAQIFGCCNPEGVYHWIMRRAQGTSVPGLQIYGRRSFSGYHMIGSTMETSFNVPPRLKLYSATHEDNPLMYNHRKGRYTEAGQSYLRMLGQLSGRRREQLLHGKWITREHVQLATA